MLTGENPQDRELAQLFFGVLRMMELRGSITLQERQKIEGVWADTISDKRGKERK